MMKFKALVGVVVAFCAMAQFARATDDVFDSKGVKIRYVTEGQGEAIVFIHGWLGDSSMWGQDGAGNTKLPNSPGYQLIALDCRGHGKSDKFYDSKKYGAEMAADVVRLLDHLKIKKAHLVGYSMGAFIAGKVAATHPERVLSVIYGGQAPLIIGTKRDPSAGPGEVEVFAKAVEEGKGLGSYLLAVWPPDKPKPTLDQANAITKYLYGAKDVKALAAAGLSLGDLAVSMEDLKKCKAPVMFIYGSKEPEVLKERVALLRKTLGQGELTVVEGADHMSTLSSPEFKVAISKFLTSFKEKAKR